MLKFGLSTWLICPDKIPFRRYFGRKRKRKFEVGLCDGQIWASFLTNDVLKFLSQTSHNSQTWASWKLVANGLFTFLFTGVSYKFMKSDGNKTYVTLSLAGRQDTAASKLVRVEQSKLLS